VRQYDDGRRIDEVLTRSLALDRQALRRLDRTRALRLNRRPATLRERVRVGDVVAWSLAETEYVGLDAVEMPLDIRLEDDWLLVVNKAPYLLVHPTVPEQRHTLVNGLTHHFQRQGRHVKVHPVHRLDRDTSGLVLIARTPEAHARLSRQLGSRALKREYRAVVHGEVRDEHGTMDAPIGPHPAQKPLRAVRPDGDAARTHYRVLERLTGATLLALELESGRTHQIRVHMAHLGHPLLGDRQYGRRGLTRIGRQALHAARLRFDHPATGVEVQVEAALPADVRALLATLRAGADRPERR
jgi:23S rRNA pseudouridine1911/1915/1917 synthase